MRNNDGVCLASREGFGQIYDCGSCGNIHVQVGPVTVTLDAAAYMQFVDLVSTSAANFELWLQVRNHETNGLMNGSPQQKEKGQ